MATPVLKAFELEGADGLPLRGDARTATPDRPAIVICHGFKGFKNWGFFPRLADRLARAGFTAVSFNFSASGVGPDGESFSEPDRFRRWTYRGDLVDLANVIDAVRGGTLVAGLAGIPSVGLFGHSRGGAVAVLRAALDSEIRSLVTWAAVSSPLRWGPETLDRWRHDGQLDIVNARTGEVLALSTDVLDDIEQHPDARDIPARGGDVAAPWLIVQGAVDEAVPVTEAETLARHAGPRARLEIVEQGSHTFGARHPWAGSTPQLDRAMDVTVEWFTRTMT